MAGRNRLPKEIKQLQGTYEANKDYPHLDYEVVNELPSPAFDLDERALEIWGSVCKDLKQVNILRSRYVYELTNYCKWCSIYEDALQNWEKEKTVAYTNKAGATNEVPSVWYKIMIDASEKVSELGRQFGFTAASASKINLKDQKPKRSALSERIAKKVNVG